MPLLSITRTCGNKHVRVGRYRSRLARGLPSSARILRDPLKLRARAEAAPKMRLWLRFNCSRRDKCSSPRILFVDFTKKQRTWRWDGDKGKERVERRDKHRRRGCHFLAFNVRASTYAREHGE